MKRRYFWAFLHNSGHLEESPTERVVIAYDAGDAGPQDDTLDGFETEEEAVKAFDGHQALYGRNGAGKFSRGLFLITKYIPE